MNFKEKLKKFNFTPNNSIVIGSGILNKLKIRESNDIDIVTTEEKYNKIKEKEELTEKKTHGRKILTDDVFEIGTSWETNNKKWKLKDLKKKSTIIKGIRYISIDFLLKVKNSWIKNGEAREKDIKDVKLIKQYIKNKNA